MRASLWRPRGRGFARRRAPRCAATRPSAGPGSRAGDHLARAVVRSVHDDERVEAASGPRRSQFASSPSSSHPTASRRLKVGMTTAGVGSGATRAIVHSSAERPGRALDRAARTPACQSSRSAWCVSPVPTPVTGPAPAVLAACACAAVGAASGVVGAYVASSNASPAAGAGRPEERGRRGARERGRDAVACHRSLRGRSNLVEGHRARELGRVGPSGRPRRARRCSRWQLVVVQAACGSK